MARKKATNQLADPAVIDLDAVYNVLIDLQMELLAERNAVDFCGHDYGYKCGYATTSVNYAIALLEGRTLGDIL